jgi:hypothetical protein
MSYLRRNHKFCGHDFDENKVVNSEQEQVIDIAIPLSKDDYVAQCPICQTWSTHAEWCSHCKKPLKITEEMESPKPESSQGIIEAEAEKSQVPTTEEGTHEPFGAHNRQCPKCGYERQPKDDEIVPLYECPRCQVVYEKYIARANKDDSNKRKLLNYIRNIDSSLIKAKSHETLFLLTRKPVNTGIITFVCLATFMLSAFYVYTKGIKPYMETKTAEQREVAKYNAMVKEYENQINIPPTLIQEYSKLLDRKKSNKDPKNSNIKLHVDETAKADSKPGIIQMNLTIENENHFDIKDVIIECTYKDKDKSNLLVNKKTVNDVIKGKSSKTFKNVDMGYFHPQTVTASCGIVDSKFAP